MSNLHVFAYNNYQITFDFGGNQKMVNATEMAKPFKGKLPADFLRLKQTKVFIEELNSQYGNSHIGKIVKVVKGGVYNGTWMCEKLALKFAAWLSAKFEIWVFDKIQELFKQGYTQISGLWVYFFQSTNTKAVKIGKSFDLEGRQRRIENSHGYAVKLLKAIRVPDESHERSIHKQFKHIRLRGEWFKFTNELKQYIEGLPNHLDPQEQELRSENSELLLKNKDLQHQVHILEDFRKMVLSQIQGLKTQHRFDQNSLEEAQNYNQLIRDLLYLDISKWLNEPLDHSKVMRNLRIEVKAYQRQLALAWLHIVEKDALLEAIAASHQSAFSELSAKSQKNFTRLSLLIHKRLKG